MRRSKAWCGVQTGTWEKDSKHPDFVPILERYQQTGKLFWRAAITCPFASTGSGWGSEGVKESRRRALVPPSWKAQIKQNFQGAWDRLSRCQDLLN